MAAGVPTSSQSVAGVPARRRHPVTQHHPILSVSHVNQISSSVTPRFCGGATDYQHRLVMAANNAPASVRSAPSSPR
jgi:hypothetical protein